MNKMIVGIRFHDTFIIVARVSKTDGKLMWEERKYDIDYIRWSNARIMTRVNRATSMITADITNRSLYFRAKVLSIETELTRRRDAFYKAGG